MLAGPNGLVEEVWPGLSHSVYSFTGRKDENETRARFILGGDALSEAVRESPVRTEPHPTRTIRSDAMAPTDTGTDTDTIFLASGGTKPD